jgi:hypothetical protein
MSLKVPKAGGPALFKEGYKVGLPSRSTFHQHPWSDLVGQGIEGGPDGS